VALVTVESGVYMHSMPVLGGKRR